MIEKPTTIDINVSIVMPVHNRRQTTINCLQSLRALERRGPTFRILTTVIVVDDGSTDGTAAALAADFPEVRLLAGDGTLFYAEGTNVGIREALRHGPRYVVTMNDDSVVDRHALVEMVSCALKAENTIVGAVLVRWDSDDLIFQVDPRWETLYGGWHFFPDARLSELPDAPFAVQSLVGNFLLYPVSALQHELLPSDKFRKIWGDVQFVRVLQRRGFLTVVCPTAIVRCEPNTYPPPLRTLSVRDLVAALWSDSHPLGFPAVWRSRWYSAPTKPLGALAFVAQIFHMAARAFRLGAWPSYPPSGPPFGRWAEEEP